MPSLRRGKELDKGSPEPDKESDKGGQELETANYLELATCVLCLSFVLRCFFIGG